MMDYFLPAKFFLMELYLIWIVWDEINKTQSYPTVTLSFYKWNPVLVCDASSRDTGYKLVCLCKVFYFLILPYTSQLTFYIFSVSEVLWVCKKWCFLRSFFILCFLPPRTTKEQFSDHSLLQNCINTPLEVLCKCTISPQQLVMASVVFIFWM